jgi:hypothetical protein
MRYRVRFSIREMADRSILTPFAAKRPARSSWETGGEQRSRASRTRFPIWFRAELLEVFFIQACAPFTGLTFTRIRGVMCVKFTHAKKPKLTALQGN